MRLHINPKFIMLSRFTANYGYKIYSGFNIEPLHITLNKNVTILCNLLTSEERLSK